MVQYNNKLVQNRITITTAFYNFFCTLCTAVDAVRDLFTKTLFMPIDHHAIFKMFKLRFCGSDKKC